MTFEASELSDYSLAFQQYHSYAGMQSVNGLNQNYLDAVNGHAPIWSRVDFGFHSTSDIISAEKTISAGNQYLIEMETDPMLAAARAPRPGGPGTGVVYDESPIGDAVIPLLLMLVGYTLIRRIKQMRTAK